MSNLNLHDIARCFDGIIPATLATCARDGTPNLSVLSHVQYIDTRHVALSRQFFNKTVRNIQENPWASVGLWDPINFTRYVLKVRFVRSETTGPLFDSMSVRIDAIASHTGMTGIFRLIGADIYEVLEIESDDVFEPELAEKETEDTDSTPPAFRGELWALQRICASLARARDLDELLGNLLGSMDEVLGFSHGMILLPNENNTRLFTVATHGFADSGIGAEIEMGEGLVGRVAQGESILRLSSVEAALRYGRTVRNQATAEGLGGNLRPEIQIPGLANAQGHVAIPLRVSGRLIGVLSLQSASPQAVEAWHDAFLSIMAGQIALAVQNFIERDDIESPTPAVSNDPSHDTPLQATRTFRFFPADDCVFVDGEYLIRNLPGRILWWVLGVHAQTGRTEFTNRELRLLPSLGLPSFKDNLESRLILLRKRLEQKCPTVQLVPSGRGRFRLETSCRLILQEDPGDSPPSSRPK